MSTLKLAGGISKPLEIYSDYTEKRDVVLTKDGKTTGKQLFFGIKKSDSINNTLNDNVYKLYPSDPQINECSYMISKSKYNNGGKITYYISENTGTSSRIITFKYNGTVLFKINLDYNKNNNPTPTATIYIIEIKSIYNTYDITLCIFNKNFGETFTSTTRFKSYSFRAVLNGYMVFYFVDGPSNLYFDGCNMSELLNNNILKYKEGKNLENINKFTILYKKAPSLINTDNTGISSRTTNLTLDTIMYGYMNEKNTTNYKLTKLNGISFSNISHDNHYGVYEFFGNTNFKNIIISAPLVFNSTYITSDTMTFTAYLFEGTYTSINLDTAGSTPYTSVTLRPHGNNKLLFFVNKEYSRNSTSNDVLLSNIGPISDLVNLGKLEYVSGYNIITNTEYSSYEVICLTNDMINHYHDGTSFGSLHNYPEEDYRVTIHVPNKFTKTVYFQIDKDTGGLYRVY